MYQQFKDCAPKEFLHDADPCGRQLVFVPDSPELQAAISMLIENGISYRLFSDTAHTRKELSETPFFFLDASYPLELEGTSLIDYGTQYQGVCPRCGFGGHRVGDIFVDRKFVKKVKIAHLIPEIVVSPGIKYLIESNGLTGISFPSMVRDFKGREINPLYVADIHSVLPPMSNSTWLMYSDVLSCGHGTLYLQSDMQYEESKLEPAKDFNLTYEYLNNWKIRHIVVSKRVRDIFNSSGIKLRYKPVTILDD